MPSDAAVELKAIHAEMREIKYSIGRLIEHLRLAIVTTSGGSDDVKMRDILQFTAAHFGVPSIDILSVRRTGAVRRPREIAMYLCRHLTTRSYPEIALFFNKRHHSTVWHAVGEATHLMEKDRKIADEVGVLAAEILKAAKDKEGN